MTQSNNDYFLLEYSSFILHYQQVLRRDLVHALINKRPGIPLEHYLLHQDNAPPKTNKNNNNTAASSQLKIDVLGCGRVQHPPYSPDLAPFDFAVFPEVKSQLNGRRFSTLSELRSITSNIISQYGQDWYRDIFDKWVKRHRQCVAYDK